jgi:hypothetical protein
MPVATPEVTGTPFPSALYTGSDTNPEFEMEGKWVARGIRLGRSTGKAITAGSVMFNALESGRSSVSAPSIPIGSRREFLQGYGFNGTTYNPSTITKITGRQLVSGALSKASWITAGVTSLIGNAIDYGFGKNKDKGFGQEFAVSTGVDTMMAVGTGFIAAGAIALGTAFLGITLSVPLAIVATVVAGLAIGGVLDAVGAGDYIKEKANLAVDAVEIGVQNLAQGVADGVEAWKGVADNSKLIGIVVGERITDAAESAASTVTNIVNNTVEAAENTIDAAGTAITNTVERIGESIKHTISNTINALGNLLGSVFSGGG